MKKHLISLGIMAIVLTLAGVIIFCLYAVPGFGEILVGGVLVFACCMLALVVYVGILGGVERHMERREYRKSEQQSS